MGNLKVFLLLTSSLLLASATSLIFSSFLAQWAGPLLFAKDIPSLSNELSIKKAFDLIDFGLTSVLGFTYFFVNFFVIKVLSRKFTLNSYSTIPYLWLFVSSLVIFIQTHFVTFSRSQIALLIILFESIYILLFFLKKLAFPKQISLFSIGNGLFLGFYLSLLLNHFFSIPLLSILVLFSVPVLLGLFENKFLAYFPGFLLLISILFPTDLTKLIILGSIVVVFWITLFLLKKPALQNLKVLNLIYPFLVIFLLIYNPNFYIGNFDTVEEGFFLGWIERLRLGQFLYKDVAVYHPPFLTWGMFLFSKVFGFTIWSERLFLHLLQIAGSIFFFYFVKNFLKKPLYIFVLMIFFLSITSTLVRNNVEIRLGFGLLSLLFLFRYLESNSKTQIIISGVLSAVSLFVSSEFGTATIITILISVLLFSKNRIRSLLYLLLGVNIVVLPTLSYLLLTSSLIPFFQDIFFYAKAFSEGYLNLALERSISLSFFHWHIFDQYLSSTAFFWEVSKSTLIATAAYLLYGFTTKKNLDLGQKRLLILILFSTILLRSALGRSDSYHFLPILILSLVLILYFLQQLSYKSIAIPTILIVLLLSFFFRPQINSVFLENTIFKFQTYGKALESYNSYQNKSFSILVGKEINTKDMDNLIAAIDKYTSPSDPIFVFPWTPEIYFLTARKNSTSYDTPYAFFTQMHQQEMIDQLTANPPKVVIFNPEMKFANLTPGRLTLINDFISKNYKSVETFGSNQILQRIN